MTGLSKIDKLVNECSKYEPLDGRILVHLMKIKKVKQDDYSFDLANTKANEGKDPAKHRVDLEKVNPIINAKYQEAIVLQVPLDETRVRPYDKIVYPMGATNPFDLIKGVNVLQKYNVVAVIRDHDIIEQPQPTISKVATSLPLEESVWENNEGYEYHKV